MARASPLIQWYIDHHICVGCKKEDAMPGRQKCPDCLYKQQLANIKYRSLERERGYYERRREKRMQRIADGLCPICGKPAARGQLCMEHYIKKQRAHEREKEERRRRGDPRRERMNAGLCIWCENTALPDKHVCERHYNDLMNRKGFATRGGDDHPWSKDEKARLESIRRKKSRNSENG